MTAFFEAGCLNRTAQAEIRRSRRRVYGGLRRDPHPEEPAYRQYTQPENIDQRKQYAQELADTRSMDATVIVDSMADEISKEYGSLPNMVYVIDREGTIAYKATWTLSEKIDQVLSQMMAAEDTPQQASA